MIGIFSGKGGVGKTTVAANLGVAFSQLGREPLLIDTNIKASSLGFHLGFYEDLPVTLRDISNNKASIDRGIFLHPEYDLRFLPSPVEGVNSKLRYPKELFENLKKNYDIIIADMAPAFSNEAMKVMEVIDKALIVSTPTTPAVADAMRASKTLRERNKEIFGIILNKVGREEDELRVGEIEDSCRAEVLATIPYGKAVKKSMEEGAPVVARHPNTKVAVEFKKLAADLLGVKWQPPGIIRRVKNFFGINKGPEVSRTKKSIYTSRARNEILGKIGPEAEESIPKAEPYEKTETYTESIERSEYTEDFDDLERKMKNVKDKLRKIRER